MKKILNKSLQTALLRGAVMLSGGTLAGVLAVFSNSIYGVIMSVLIVAGFTARIDESIKNSKR
jgi:hypothetical protein